MTAFVSPDQLVGRGLKLGKYALKSKRYGVSPDQLVGRGLKQDNATAALSICEVSPDQLVGRGLKRAIHVAPPKAEAYRPINWSGAD